MRRENASVQRPSRQLGVPWRTVWCAVKPILQKRADDDARFAGVSTLGVDEHLWHHVSTKPGAEGVRGPKELTGMVDLTRDQHERVRARLLDLVPGRSRKAYADWLPQRGDLAVRYRRISARRGPAKAVRVGAHHFEHRLDSVEQLRVLRRSRGRLLHSLEPRAGEESFHATTSPTRLQRRNQPRDPHCLERKFIFVIGGDSTQMNLTHRVPHSGGCNPTQKRTKNSPNRPSESVKTV